MCIRLVSIAVLLAIVAKGDALKCYTCIGSETSDCQKGSGSSVVQNCFDFEGYDIVPHCVQVTLEKGYESPYVYRTCLYARPGNDICEIISTQEPPRNCKYCTKDYCNNSPVGNKTVHY